MKYTESEIFEFIEDNDVKFIKLSFCDVYGKRKIISILPAMLSKALNQGVTVDATLISGFKSAGKILLYPDPATLTLLPWRPTHGSVARFYCNLRDASGEQIAADSRHILSDAEDAARNSGLSIKAAVENEFYLLKQDDAGNPSDIPFDNAGYLDEPPFDKGEDVRRDICLTLEEMGISPLSSQHIRGPGQNRIDFTPGKLLETADNVNTFRSVVMTMAARGGLWASFMPKPLPECARNMFRIKLSVRRREGNCIDSFMAGILQHISEITVILNPLKASYEMSGPACSISWSNTERNALLRRRGEYGLELSLADSSANPYLAFAAVLYAGLDGVERSLTLSKIDKQDMEALPAALREAQAIFRNSAFIKRCFPKEVIEIYGGE